MQAKADCSKVPYTKANGQHRKYITCHMPTGKCTPVSAVIDMMMKQDNVSGTAQRVALPILYIRVHSAACNYHITAAVTVPATAVSE